MNKTVLKNSKHLLQKIRMKDITNQQNRDNAKVKSTNLLNNDNK